MPFLTKKRLAAGLVGGLAVLASACNYTQTAQTLKITQQQEGWTKGGGDEPLVSVLEYRSTPGKPGSTAVRFAGGTDQLGQDKKVGAVLTIPSSYGQAHWTNLDYSHCERAAAGQMPEIVGQVYVVFENDFSNQQTAFMNDIRGRLTTRLQNNVESITFPDRSNCGDVVNRIAGALPNVAAVRDDVTSRWPAFDEGFFTDDDDLLGTAFTAYANVTDHVPGGKMAEMLDPAMRAQLTRADQAGGVINTLTGTVPSFTDGRTDVVRVSGDGATYEIQVRTDNTEA